MPKRVSLVLVSAVILAVLGASPVGEAAGDAVRVALFAKNAGKVNGIKAARTPKAGRLLALGADGTFPASVVPPGPPAPRVRRARRAIRGTRRRRSSPSSPPMRRSFAAVV